MNTKTEYENPPVVETILGVQFERLPSFKNAHLGAFWKALDPRQWPNVLDAPPLPFQFESFSPSARWSKGINLQFTQDPSSRLQIKNTDANRMIQVQNGRLHLNWLGEGGGHYPGYERLRNEFKTVLQSFSEFVNRERIGTFKPNQWEVTYLDHIPKGTIWHTPADWNFFTPVSAMPILPGLIQGESFDGSWHFVIPPNRGRLHVQWQHGVKAGDVEEEIIVLTFTARGPLPEREGIFDAISEGLDTGREIVVRSFKELMRADANKAWGLKNATSS